MFTGSSEKGKLVAANAAKNLTPCILELGGKSPTVIDDSANIDLAAKKIVFGRFSNCGQICVAPDYVLIHQSKVAEFQKLCGVYIKEFFDNGKNVSDMGHMITPTHKERICQLLKDHKGQVLFGNANAHEDKDL